MCDYISVKEYNDTICFLNNINDIIAEIDRRYKEHKIYMEKMTIKNNTVQIEYNQNFFTPDCNISYMTGNILYDTKELSPYLICKPFHSYPITDNIIMWRMYKRGFSVAELSRIWDMDNKKITDMLCDTKDLLKKNIDLYGKNSSLVSSIRYDMNKQMKQYFGELNIFTDIPTESIVLYMRNLGISIYELMVSHLIIDTGFHAFDNEREFWKSHSKVF